MRYAIMIMIVLKPVYISGERVHGTAQPTSLSSLFFTCAPATRPTSAFAAAASLQFVPYFSLTLGRASREWLNYHNSAAAALCGTLWLFPSDGSSFFQQSLSTSSLPGCRPLLSFCINVYGVPFAARLANWPAFVWSVKCRRRRCRRWWRKSASGGFTYGTMESARFSCKIMFYLRIGEKRGRWLAFSVEASHRAKRCCKNIHTYFAWNAKKRCKLGSRARVISYSALLRQRLLIYIIIALSVITAQKGIARFLRNRNHNSSHKEHAEHAKISNRYAFDVKIICVSFFYAIHHTAKKNIHNCVMVSFPVVIFMCSFLHH